MWVGSGSGLVGWRRSGEIPNWKEEKEGVAGPPMPLCPFTSSLAQLACFACPPRYPNDCARERRRRRRAAVIRFFFSPPLSSYAFAIFLLLPTPSSPKSVFPGQNSPLSLAQKPTRKLRNLRWPKGMRKKKAFKSAMRRGRKEIHCQKKISRLKFPSKKIQKRKRIRNSQAPVTAAAVKGKFDAPPSSP